MCRQGANRAARRGVKNAVRTYPALALEPRVPALWLATFLGYGFFEALHRVKRRPTSP